MKHFVCIIEETPYWLWNNTEHKGTLCNKMQSLNVRAGDTQKTLALKIQTPKIKLTYM